MKHPILTRRPEYFKRLFRMPIKLFDALAERIEARKEGLRRRGTRGGALGAPEVCETKIALAMSLRYLAGGGGDRSVLHLQHHPEHLLRHPEEDP